MMMGFNVNWQQSAVGTMHSTRIASIFVFNAVAHAGKIAKGWRAIVARDNLINVIVERSDSSMRNRKWLSGGASDGRSRCQQNGRHHTKHLRSRSSHNPVPFLRHSINISNERTQKIKLDNNELGRIWRKEERLQDFLPSFSLFNQMWSSHRTAKRSTCRI